MLYMIKAFIFSFFNQGMFFFSPLKVLHFHSSQETRFFRGACPDFSSAGHLPSKDTLVLSENTEGFRYFSLVAKLPKSIDTIVT